MQQLEEWERVVVFALIQHKIQNEFKLHIKLQYKRESSGHAVYHYILASIRIDLLAIIPRMYTINNDYCYQFVVCMQWYKHSCYMCQVSNIRKQDSESGNSRDC